MNTIISPSLFGTVTIGLRLGYTEYTIDKTDIIKSLQKYQKDLILKKDIYLSSAVSECLIVLNNQAEPHLKLDFINYPKFQLTKNDFKSEISTLGIYLMKEYKQNRIVITFQDETIMYEESDDVDHRVKE